MTESSQAAEEAQTVASTEDMDTVQACEDYGPTKELDRPTTTSQNKDQELLMRANGHLKYQQSIAPKVTPKGTEVHQSVTDRPAHFSALKAALPKVTEGLRANLKSALDAKGRPPMWLGPLSSVDPSTLAYIGLLCAFNGVLKDLYLD